MWWHVMSHYDLVTSCDIALRRHMTSHNEFWGVRNRKCPTWEVCERSGVFILDVGKETSIFQHPYSRLCVEFTNYSLSSMPCQKEGLDWLVPTKPSFVMTTTKILRTVWCDLHGPPCAFWWVGSVCNQGAYFTEKELSNWFVLFCVGTWNNLFLRLAWCGTQMISPLSREVHNLHVITSSNLL